MWPATFDAECGVGIYVALGSIGGLLRRFEAFERHIIS
jgi:hypothetical protein